jgi:hypothetical protein
VLQGKLVRTAVTERVKDLIAAADGAAKLVEASLKRVPAHGGIDADKLDAAAADGGDGFVVAGATLALWLSTKPDWAGKAELCAHLLRDAKSAPVLALLDRTLAELLSLEPAAAALGVGSENPLAIVRLCLALSGEAAALAETTPLVRGIVQACAGRGTPALDLTARERLRAALASPASFAKRDPAGEMKMARGLRARIAALPLLAGDPAIFEELSRRFARMVAPESLDPVLAHEQGVVRKLVLLLQLHAELDDSGARRSLEGAIANWLAYRDFKDEFFAVGISTEDRAAQLVETGKAFQIAGIPDALKLRFKELAAVHFAAPQAGDRRISQRMVAGPEDKVQAMGQRVPLRNWSESGLLFGPAVNFFVGQRLQASVILRNAYLNIVFDAELEIVRVADGLVGARYKCLSSSARGRIKTHLAGR